MDTQGESSTSTNFFYDVFLSFSGEDTRKTFTSHLNSGLRREGINIFKDDKELRKGDVISMGLSKGIEESRIALVVLSTNYASTPWCLDELVKILECKKELNQRVMPIFYNVLPTQVRHQTEEFGEKFHKLKERFSHQRIKKWEAALTQVVTISGRQLANRDDESEFIEAIIKDVKKEVKGTPLEVARHPVGVDCRAKDIIESLWKNGSNDEVRMVGIYGVGGIGKTTLAKDIYNRLFQHGNFGTSCFLADVRSEDEKFGLNKLQEKLLNVLFKTEDFKVNNVPQGNNLIKNRLESRKVLIVLDDVDTEKQLESLAREKSWFGSGSVIIITTRDKRVLHRLGEKERYEAELLNDNEAMLLFYRHAFDIRFPPQDYVDLAKDIINYSGGLPLALVTLGSHLHGRSIKEWRREFKKLRAIPHNDIQKILKISFDGLDADTKTVFLDIACAFHDLTEHEVTKILDACDFHTESEIATLVQKHLLQKDGVYLVMHDLVRNMGREIVRSESPQYPGKRSRLFIPEQVYNVLLGNNASENVEILKLDRAGELKGVELSTEAFEPMKKLRVLIINELRISGDFGLFSKELRWLSWQKCPLQYIPPNFPAGNLVVLNMQESDIEEFDLNLQFCKKLKELNLSYCKRLRKISNFNGARSLETLQLQYCNLSEAADIPRDIGSLSSLISLDLSGNGFHGLPFDFSKLRFLKELHLNDCENLQTLPSVSNLENLEILELKNCRKLVKITELDNLCSIVWINMRNCTSLQNPFNESFFSAPALSSFPSMKNSYQILRICVQCNEIPDWCSNKVIAPSTRFTMPTVHNNKFLGMVLWFVCDFLDVSTFRYFVVNVGDKQLCLTWNRYTETPQLHGEVSCIYYISHLNRPFDREMIKGGETMTVEEEFDRGTVKKIGIHLLYLDQHGNVTSLPAIVDHSYPYPQIPFVSNLMAVWYDEYHYL